MNTKRAIYLRSSTLLLLLLLLWATPARAAFVQHTESSATITSGGATAAFGSSTTSGNAILVWVRVAGFGASDVLSSVSAGGQSCTLVVKDTTTNPGLFGYICENITGAGSVTATTTWASNAGTDPYAWIAADEYSSVPTSSVVDTSYVATGTGTTDLTVTGITTNAAGETVVAVASQSNFATMSAGTDFTLRDAAIVLAGGIEDYTPAGTLSSYTAHFTSTVTNGYCMLVITMKTSGGGPASPTPKCNGGLLLRGVGCQGQP